MGKCVLVIKSILPRPLKNLLKKIFYVSADCIDDLLGLRDPLIPKRTNIFTGGGNYKKTGEEFLKYFIEFGRLQPQEKVLDVGCGMGRMAVPLTKFLSSQGEYCGFDIVRDGVDWCLERFSPKFANFHFLHSDVYNKHYNSNGKYLAADYKFPYKDNSFDFVYLTSVFTHMLPKDLQNYLAEISRVLKPGGRCLITYFLLNPESNGLIRTGLSSFNFIYEIEGCFTSNENDPEDAIAYNEDHIRDLYQKFQLKIMDPVHFGSWCGRNAFTSYQDMIVAYKL